ncbi:hypothetical protein GLGR_1906 [Leminorella grimontii ATCC 33999 = DSM 5078]|nr:hypothetical protein GLGR_1906 [Leminorella grimontii ATCC 33999 = DSM 5078]
MINKMVEHIDGGRSVAAHRLGLTEMQFKNRLYEMNGTRFFSIDELESLQDFSKTHFVADYFAQRAGCAAYQLPEVSELDNVELHALSLFADVVRGEVDKLIHESINNDGVIDKAEKKLIWEAIYKEIAARIAEISATIRVNSRDQ